MILAIVGSTKFADDPLRGMKAAVIIRRWLEIHDPERVVSGGARGIDQLAAMTAREMGVPVTEHLPQNKRWEPDGYKARNLLIAEDCTHLLAIRHKRSQTYGSGWTADRAAALGKKVWRIRL